LEIGNIWKIGGFGRITILMGSTGKFWLSLTHLKMLVLAEKYIFKGISRRYLEPS